MSWHVGSARVLASMVAGPFTRAMIDSLTHAKLPSMCRRNMLAAAAVVAAMLPVARCDAQARSEKWMLGLGMQAPVPPERGVTAHVARAIAQSLSTPLRLEASVAVSVRHVPRVCLEGPCDTRLLGQTAELAVVTSQLASSALGLGALGVLAGGGIYVSRWDRGWEHQSRGLGPSGLLLEAGVALRHLLQQPLMLEALVRSYAGSGSNDKLTLGVRFARIF